MKWAGYVLVVASFLLMWHANWKLRRVVAGFTQRQLSAVRQSRCPLCWSDLRQHRCAVCGQAFGTHDRAAHRAAQAAGGYRGPLDEADARWEGEHAARGVAVNVGMLRPGEEVSIPVRRGPAGWEPVPGLPVTRTMMHDESRKMSDEPGGHDGRNAELGRPDAAAVTDAAADAPDRDGYPAGPAGE